MSFSRPGPKRDDALSAVVGGKGLDSRPGKLPEYDEFGSPVPSDDDAQAISAGPPGQQTLMQHERARLAALDAGDKKLADNALREVIGDLDALLASAAAKLRAPAGSRRTKKQVRKVVPQLVAIDELGYLPLADVAELLHLTRADVDGVLASLAARGELGSADREQALAQIQQVRTKLQEIEVSRDHSQLDGLVGFILKIALLVTIAVASTPLGALAVGDPMVAEAIKTGIIALVAVALQQAVDGARAWQETHDQYAVAQQAREELLAELQLAKNLTKDPAYENEHLVLRFRLEIRCASARVSSVPLDWPDKEQYLLVLDQVTSALDNGTPKSLILIRRKLEATPTPNRGD
ncbi:hypothetical protein F1D05_28905 [Kribbella qitaiheensis]|uniref:Uncharacterized protein n=1 Tax=Kribbella qitaiheensis TaxID=1544730 RepID=A0A7G6X4N0_9ACTN|nr:hypothetical protein [Kribbella qitaiheensis]QNE21195.1 hypothetical protein F1D05_28905 [Kribbella qitaiheensis]